MDLRRRHFAGAALAGFGASAFIGGRASAQARTLRFGHLHSVDSPVKGFPPSATRGPPKRFLDAGEPSDIRGSLPLNI